jgi:hypothetical protein
MRKEHYSRNESSLSGRDTPLSRLNLRRIEEVHRPELEQDVDLFIDDGEVANMLQIFKGHIRSDIPIHRYSSAPQLHLLKLPAIARMRIYEYCLPEERR